MRSAHGASVTKRTDPATSSGSRTHPSASLDARRLAARGQRIRPFGHNRTSVFAAWTGPQRRESLNFSFSSAFAQSLLRKNSLARQLQYLWRTDLVDTFTEGDRHVSFRSSVRLAQECHLLCSVRRDRERKSCNGCAGHSVAHGAREHHTNVDMTCGQAAT